MDEQNLSYAAICRRAKIHATTVNKWVTKHVPPSIAAIKKIAQATGVSESWLLSGKGDRIASLEQRRRPYTATEVCQVVGVYNKLIEKSGRSEDHIPLQDREDLMGLLILMNEKKLPMSNLVKIFESLMSKE